MFGKLGSTLMIALAIAIIAGLILRPTPEYPAAMNLGIVETTTNAAPDATQELPKEDVVEETEKPEEATTQESTDSEDKKSSDASKAESSEKDLSETPEQEEPETTDTTTSKTEPTDEAVSDSDAIEAVKEVVKEALEKNAE